MIRSDSEARDSLRNDLIRFRRDKALAQKAGDLVTAAQVQGWIEKTEHLVSSLAVRHA
jgi:hypothetical protein